MKIGFLQESIKNELKSFYLIKGNDAFLRERAIKIFENLLDDQSKDFNLSKISILDGIDNIVDALQTMPVFSDFRVVVVKDADDVKLADENFKAVENYMKDFNPQSILVLVDANGNLKSFEKLAEIVDCSRMTDEELLLEIDKILEIPPVSTMDIMAKRKLISATNGDMARIFNEMQKLKNYANGKIVVDDVEKLVSVDVETKIFELSSAVCEKNNSKALKVLYEFINDNVSPMTAFSLLITQYRRLLHIALSRQTNVDDIAKDLDIRPNYAFVLKKLSKNYTQIKLKKIVEKLADMQFQIVSESVDGNFALQNAVAMLMVI